MTNLEMLIFGVKHIAENHKLRYSVEYEEDGEVAILGGMNIPTLMDIKMLCEDVGIDENFIDPCEFGIDIWIPCDWFEEVSNKEFQGQCLWQRTSCN
jgi:hypothetical protein